MNVRPKNYIPCLRWKVGEYQAVLKLSQSSHSSIFPIFEVSEFGNDREYDFERRKRPKTLDEHLSTFTTNIKRKWGIGECFIDMKYVPQYQVLGDGRNPSEYVFDDLDKKGVHFIPMVRFQDDMPYQNSLQNLINKKRIGLCLRVNLDDFADDNFETQAKDLLQSYGLTFGDCDLILDLEIINFEDMTVLSVFLTDLISSKTRLNAWNTFGIIGTSFPQTLSKYKKGISLVERKEWILYKLLSTNLQNRGVRIPVFGDYAINNPILQKVMDWRKVKRMANIRYTINEKWLIVKGENVKDHKSEQYRQLCQSIIFSGYYCGPDYSYGDRYIEECAQGKASTGNASTWRQVGTNHHIEMVVKDVAKLVGS